ncbi:MAG: hypothetical protein AB7O37_23430 [Vicinamibacteria bacterium]
MRKLLALIIGLSLATAFSAGAQPPGDPERCPELYASSEAGCCGDAPATQDCTGKHCAGVVLPVAPATRGHAPCASSSAATRVTQFIAGPARAPDTAPPKPLV